MLIPGCIIKFAGVDFNIKKSIKKGGEPIISVSFILPDDFVGNYSNIKKGKNGKRYLNCYSKHEIPCYKGKDLIDSDYVLPESECSLLVTENNNYLNVHAIQLVKKGISPFN